MAATSVPAGCMVRIDDLGRITIPAGLLRRLGIKPSDELEAFACEGGVFLRVAGVIQSHREYAAEANARLIAAAPELYEALRAIRDTHYHKYRRGHLLTCDDPLGGCTCGFVVSRERADVAAAALAKYRGEATADE